MPQQLGRCPAAPTAPRAGLQVGRAHSERVGSAPAALGGLWVLPPAPSHTFTLPRPSSASERGNAPHLRRVLQGDLRAMQRASRALDGKWHQRTWEDSDPLGSDLLGV